MKLDELAASVELPLPVRAPAYSLQPVCVQKYRTLVQGCDYCGTGTPSPRSCCFAYS
jgi:hypothetical protein